MSSSPTTSPATQAAEGGPAVIVSAKDLHGPGVVFCPNPKMALWSNHPKVYIDVSHGEGRCAYCGTVYRLAPGTQLSGHH